MVYLNEQNDQQFLAPFGTLELVYVYFRQKKDVDRLNISLDIVNQEVVNLQLWKV